MDAKDLACLLLKYVHSANDIGAWTKLIIESQYSPVADPSMVNTCTETLLDDGLESISTSCNVSFSLTLYICCSNRTVGAI